MIFRDYAPKYFERKLPVVPIKPGTKAPLIDNWNEIDFAGRIFDYAKWGIGLRLRDCDLIVLDIDTLDVDLQKKIAKFLEDYPTPIQRIGNPKKLPARFYARSWQTEKNQIGNDVELLTIGQQIVLPPTIHPETKQPYKWVNKNTLLNFELEFLPGFPEDAWKGLQEICGETASVTASVSASDGSRCNHGSHNKLSSMMVAKVLDGQTPDTIVDELIEYDERINPDISYFACPSRKEFKTADKVFNAYQFVMQGFKSKLKAGELKGVPQEELRITIGESNESPSPVSVPAPIERIRFPQHRGIMKELFHHVYNNAPVQRSRFAWASSLITMSTLLANKVEYNGTYTNLYALIIANSGDGKNLPLQFPHDLFDAMECEELIGVTDLASDNSVLMPLSKKPSRLDVIDEAAKLFSAANDKSHFLSRIGDIYAELYTSPGRKYRGKMAMTYKVKGNEDGIIGACDSPCLSLFGAMTFRDVENHLSFNTIEKGLGGRFLYFPEEQAKDARIVERTKIHDTIIKSCRSLRSINSIAGTIDLGGDPISLAATPQAKEFLIECMAEINKRRRKYRGQIMGPVVNRMFENMTKLAIIDHMSLNPSRTKSGIKPLTKDSLEWAWRAVKSCERLAAQLLDHHVSENYFDKIENKILSSLEANNGQLTGTELCRKIRGMNPKIREDAIKSLLSAERISISRDGRKIIYQLLEDL